MKKTFLSLFTIFLMAGIFAQTKNVMSSENNTITFDNSDRRIEDDIVLTNKTDKIIELSFFVKRSASAEEINIANILLPAQMKNYEVDFIRDVDLDNYRFIIVKTQNRLEYNYNIARDNLNLTLINYDGNDTAKIDNLKNQNFIEVENERQRIKDEIKIDNKTDIKFSVVLTGITKDDNEIFLMLKTVSPYDDEDFDDYPRNYLTKFKSFKLYSDAEFFDYSKIFKNSDLKITVFEAR